ncbi:hypothetical protein [Deinococcus sp. S9]|uniref:hypothetical protein n=1 Tax=Deinococcus sp. S9 TaxID=2545754 RepID=UPI001054C8DD|nr:hypothetical protein [Deinococcus sp. S9]TDE87397.1 hypothetical protein E0686_02580 [Deinococcus sp. S9]
MSQEHKIVAGYVYASIQGASGGFGMYERHPNLGEDIYADTADLISACEPAEYVSTEFEDWREDEDTELVQAIERVTGSCYNEPPILVAMRDRDDNVTVFGIVTLDCYELANGEYIEVKRYEADPERYALAGSE